jgi:hypothetical protein
MATNYDSVHAVATAIRNERLSWQAGATELLALPPEERLEPGAK